MRILRAVIQEPAESAGELEHAALKHAEVGVPAADRANRATSAERKHGRMRRMPCFGKCKLQLTQRRATKCTDAAIRPRLLDNPVQRRGTIAGT